MKRLCLAVALFSAACTMGLHAQVLDEQAQIPFDFWLGHTVMPAGEYSIYHMNSGAVVVRRGGDHPTSAVFLAEPLSRNETRGEGKLQFTHYGDIYFLSRIWVAGEQNGYGVPKSHREKEFARRGVPSLTADVTLSSK